MCHFRVTDARLTPEMAQARHVLLCNGRNGAAPGLWRVTELGPSLLTGEELASSDCPVIPDPKAIYAVYDIEPDPSFDGWEWDVPRLIADRPERSSAPVYALILAELLQVKKPESV